MDVTEGKSVVYEYWTVDSATWMDSEPVDGVTGGRITWDLEDPERGSAVVMASDAGQLDESYVRIYMVATQRGTAERYCLGTFLMQCPETAYDGTRASVEAQGFTPLKEASDYEMPPGYAVSGDAASSAVHVMAAHVRAPVIAASASVDLGWSFAAGERETCTDYTSAMLDAAGMRWMVDARGRIYAEPMRDAAALLPVWEFEDDGRSVILPEMRMRSGLRDVPNVVRVTYSDDEVCLAAEARNDDPASPASTVARGREVTLTVTNPSLPENPVQADVDACARQTLKQESACQNSVIVRHAFIPEVSIGTAVELRYTRAGVSVTGMVSAQSLELDEACVVESSIVYNDYVWRG